MARIEKSIEIRTPVEDVFNFTRNWENYSRFYEGIYDWRPTTEITSGKGARFVYKAKALGREYEIETEVIEEVENKSRSFASVSGAETRGEWLFEPLDNGTRITYIAEYKLPIPIMGGILDTLLIKPKREAFSDKLLQNLKRLLEH